MLQAPKSGKRSAVFRSVSTPVAVGPFAMAYESSTVLKATLTFDEEKMFFHNSSRFPLTIRKNGVLSGGLIEGSAANTVSVQALTVNIAGAEVSIALSSVTGLAVSGSGRKIYAIIATGSSITKVAGTSGTASTSYGASGGPPLVSSTAVVLGYVIRDSGASSTPAASQITYSTYGGREWANNFKDKHLRPLAGRLDLYQALPLQHSGAQGAKFYLSGYHHMGSSAKIAQGKEWSLGVTQNRQDTNTQGSFAELSDGGKVSHSFSLSKLVNELNPELFRRMIDPDLHVDNLVKCYIDQTDTSKYFVFQAGLDNEFSAGQDDAVTKDVTGNVTGFVEYIDESA